MNLGVGGTHIQTIADANWEDNGGDFAKLPESPQCEVNHRTLEPQSNFPSLSLRAPATCLGRTSLDWLAKKVNCWLQPVLRMNSYHPGLHHFGREGDNASFISSLF